MKSALKLSVVRSVVAGSLASVFSAVALVLCGQRETGSPAATLNAVSHWCWREEALYRQGADVRHTVLGYLIHHGASVFWGALLAWALHGKPAGKPAHVAAAGIATSAVACFVDFRLTPERLTPGFEHRLSRRSLAVVYGAFAAGLAVGFLLIGGRKARDRA